ncbi:hypothetical protein ACFL0G_02650 [Candidatus Zixiibacteriota bacterium]
MRATAFVILLSIVLFATTAQAVVPGLINYQGTLTDDSGVALDTTVAMTFTIYSDSTATSSIWGETQPAVEVNDGIFNVLLGSVKSLSESTFTGARRWLGIQVGGDAEMSPLQELVSVGYAFHAAEADTADYAHSAPAASDGDWTVSGNDIYSAVSGNVGIGVTSPLYKLMVNGHLSLADETAALILHDGPTNRYAVDVEGTNKLRIGAGFATVFTNSSVGIGTSSPAVKLDVAGDVNANSLYQIDGITALSTEGDYNLFVGKHAGVINTSHRNAFVGDSAGVANTTGSRNTFVGAKAGKSNTAGYSNTFVGADAGISSTAGQTNTFIGAGSGRDNTGEKGTFVGWSAGQNNEGSSNTFLGNQTGMYNTTGDFNVFTGFLAGYNNTIGAFNTFLGSDAGYNNTEGDGNTFVGPRAGHGNTTGTDNTYLGRWTGRYNQTGTGNVFIGNEAGYRELYSNKLYIANGSDTSDVLIYGDFADGHVGIGTLDPEDPLHVVNDTPYGYTRAIRADMTATGELSQQFAIWGQIKSGTNNDPGAGVIGVATNTTGAACGVRGDAYSEYGRGVLAWSHDTVGNNYGLMARTDSPNGYAGYFIGGRNYFQGYVGIGTENPASELEVVGDVHVRGDITRAYTAGTSDLATPIAYAFINSGGSVTSGTPNVSASWNATYSRYEITITGESYFYNDYVTQVTVSSSSSQYVATTSSSGGILLVYIFDSGGTKVQLNFQFVTYKP